MQVLPIDLGMQQMGGAQEAETSSKRKEAILSKETELYRETFISIHDSLGTASLFP